MVERLKLPVLPMRETVVFPGVAVPITAGRPGTLEAIEKVLEGDRRLFAVCQRENVDEATPAVLYEYGVIVRVMQVQRTPNGLQLLIQGERRAKALDYTTTDTSMLEADVWAIVEEAPKEDAALEALDRELRERAGELGRRRGMPSEALAQVVQGVDEPGAFADLVAFYLDMPAHEKQRLLELFPVTERMRRVLVGVERDLLRLEAQQEIQQKVQEELGEKQREMVLREQLKAIQKELGDEDEVGDLEELIERVENLELPDEARKEIERELNKLRRTNPQSAEYQVLRTYLELVTELPWGTRTEDKIDLVRAEEILEEDHYGLEDVKDRVLEFLAVRKLQMERAEEEEQAAAGDDELAQRTAPIDIESGSPGTPHVVNGTDPDADEQPEDAPVDRETKQVRAKARAVGRGPILLFTGPPGVGKTSIAKSIARALGRKYVRIALGGARDEADIRGHRRTYVGAMPGRIIQGLRQAGTKNPVFLLDEVDKLGVSLQGDPSAALLEVLDPEQNSHFNDHYLEVDYDLSDVMFICTSNTMNIPGPLLDRMEVIRIPGYTEDEKLNIALRYLVPKQMKNNGLKKGEVEFSDDAILDIIRFYTREAGVRGLDREIAKICRKVVTLHVKSGSKSCDLIKPESLEEFLGVRKTDFGRAEEHNQVGQVTGLAWTQVGGELLTIESTVVKGKGRRITTGSLGEVMQESIQAAMTVVRSRSQVLGIKPDFNERHDLHIHVPEGATPKDGPSAGISMCTALVSAFCNIPVRADVAMTGEITLRGEVLRIGGLKEKLGGAPGSPMKPGASVLARKRVTGASRRPPSVPSR